MQGQVLVRNEYIGVNFIDTYFRSGLYPRAAFPSGLGEEGAGTVEAVGPGGFLDMLAHFESYATVYVAGTVVLCLQHLGTSST
jgi:NADPH:quinone reductase-like Zn-dependent oxidoreductase